MRFLNRVPALAAAVAPLAPLVLFSLAGCSGDKVPTYQPITDPAQLYLHLAVNHPAITMATAAPYDTLQLVATPLDARGEPIAGLPAPTFHMANPGSDTAFVQVSPDGLLTARQATTGTAGVLVVAELVAPSNVRHVDSALVQVTSDPPLSPLDTLWVEIAPPDSAILAAMPPGSFGSTGHPDGDTLSTFAAYEYLIAGLHVLQPPYPLQLAPRVRALDATQNPMPDLAIEYRSLDPDIAAISGRWAGDVSPKRAGQARMVVQATAYGVTKADTVTFTVTSPTFVHIPIIQSALGATSPFGGDRTIRTNGVVMWLNALDRPVDLVFDQPAQVVPAPADWCSWAPMILNFFLRIPDESSHCPAAAGNLTLARPDSATHSAIWRTAQLQQFTQPGTYTYHDAQSGASGRIVVVDVAHE